jgi:UDP-N-acetylglucosamine 2-epimerase (non-hydrolysing)
LDLRSLAANQVKAKGDPRVTKKIVVVYGTRPEAIKVAPVVRQLQAEAGIEVVLVSTGQHREMVSSVEEVFGLEPQVNLDVMRPGQSLSELFGRIAASMDAVLEETKPDVVLVHGDTTSAAASALAAYHRELPVAHLEAGLRSGEFWRPFPEEGNRKLIARMSQLHLAPTDNARANLLAEGVPDGQIVVTGNTVIDALHWAAISAWETPWPAPLLHLDDFSSTRMVLVTLHRRENQASAIGSISKALARFARAHDDVRIVFPMHRNPVVRQAVEMELGALQNVDLIEPVDYVTMVKLLDHAWLVVTDSGGIQEEAPAFGVPVLVARDSTERPEAITAGVARLVGGDGPVLSAALDELDEHPERWARMAHAVNPFGDGRASGRVVAALNAHLGIGESRLDLVLR